MNIRPFPLICRAAMIFCLGHTLSACDHQDTPPPVAPANTTAMAIEPVIIPNDSDTAEHPNIQLPIPSPQPTNPISQETRLKVPSFTQQAIPDDGLYLRFLATGETFYTEIKLEHGILNYTYFEDTQNRCAKWLKNTPCWHIDDLKTISAALTVEELNNLYTVTKESGILKIKADTTGGAQKGQRYYAQRLEVRLNDKVKQLTYQSFPQATPKPEAFAQIETALLAYARDLPH